MRKAIAFTSATVIGAIATFVMPLAPTMGNWFIN